MMPFIMGDPSTIPVELHGYLPLVDACDSITPGKVAYLTVTEGHVQGGDTQRRGGIHTEGGFRLFGGGWGGGRFGGGVGNGFGGGSDGKSSVLEELKELRKVGREGLSYEQSQRLEYLESIHKMATPRTDGVYMASTDGACRVWDSTTYDVDALGALNGSPQGLVEKMDPSRLYWLTDRTPHEALPSRFSGNRQFFRLVSNKVDGWWEDHNTANPLGILPDCAILRGSKFNI